MLGVNFTSVSHYLFAVGCLALLAGLCYVLLAIGMAWYLVLRPLRTDWKSSKWRILSGKMGSLVGKVALFMVAFALGYQTHKAREADRTNHMQNVDIIKKYDERHFRILSEDVMQSYDIQLCPAPIYPPWQEGQVLTDFVYEQESDCQRLKSFRNATNIETGKLINFKESQ